MLGAAAVHLRRNTTGLPPGKSSMSPRCNASLLVSTSSLAPA
jgi:hypothetical protein